MSKVVLTSLTAEDIEEFTIKEYGEAVPPKGRIRGVCARVGDRIIGFGGIASNTDGSRTVFADLTDEVRAHPVSLHKAGLKVIAMADDLGIKRLVATTKTGHPAAGRWLLRFGFVPKQYGGVTVYVRDH